MKLIKSIALGSAAILASATPAFAHIGDHNESVMANLGHWLSSPSHALFAVIGGIVAVVIIVKISKKRA
ncbi:MAG: hypothetical protein COA43_10700 [Robiginitomaculum sp.]|nr:MAG: hypothetical protein COA43_10700 [Robiginitomaculum sp.]